MATDNEAIIAQLKDKVNDMQVRHLKVQDHLMDTVKIVMAQKEEIEIAHETNDTTKRKVIQMEEGLIAMKKENEKLKDSYEFSANRLEHLENKCLTVRSNEQRIKEINDLLRVIVGDPLYAKKQWHAKLEQKKYEIMRSL